MKQDSDGVRRLSRAVVMVLGGVVASLVAVTALAVYLNTRTGTISGEDPLTVTVLLPDKPDGWRVRFAPSDVEGLGLDQAIWLSQQGSSYDFVSVGTSFIGTYDHPTYCLRGDVVDDDTSAVIITAGACLDAAEIDLTRP